MSTLRESWERKFPLPDEESIRSFAKNIGDSNPIHHDHEAARKAGLEGIIAPGVMLLGFISSAVAEEIPGVQVRRMDITFKKPLYADSLPTVCCSVSSRKHQVVSITIIVKNESTVLAKGSCLLVLPA